MANYLQVRSHRRFHTFTGVFHTFIYRMGCRHVNSCLAEHFIIRSSISSHISTYQQTRLYSYNHSTIMDILSGNQWTYIQFFLGYHEKLAVTGATPAIAGIVRWSRRYSETTSLWCRMARVNGISYHEATCLQGHVMFEVTSLFSYASHIQPPELQSVRCYPLG